MTDCIYFHQSKRARKQKRDDGFCRKLNKNVVERYDCADCKLCVSLSLQIAKAMKGKMFSGPETMGFHVKY